MGRIAEEVAVGDARAVESGDGLVVTGFQRGRCDAQAQTIA